jgi:hypothetical protein
MFLIILSQGNNFSNCKNVEYQSNDQAMFKHTFLEVRRVFKVKKIAQIGQSTLPAQQAYQCI